MNIIYPAAAVASLALVGLNYSTLCRRVVLPLIAARRHWSCDSSPRWIIEGQTRRMITVSGEHRGIRFEAVQREDVERPVGSREITEATLFTDQPMPYVAIRFPGMGRRPTMHGDVATVARLRAGSDVDWLPHWRFDESMVSMHGETINADWRGPLRPFGLLRRLDLLIDVVDAYRDFRSSSEAAAHITVAPSG